jgi:hypothetical protein
MSTAVPGAGTGPAGSGATAAPAIAPTAAAASPNAQTYSEWYADPRRHAPWKDDYHDAIGLVTIAPAGTPSTGADVRRQVRNAEDSFPQTWMALFAHPMDPTSMGEIRILHRHEFFAGPMTRQPDPTVHNRMYAFFEDFQAGQQIFTVHVPDLYFNSTPITRVPDWGVLNQAANNNSLAPSYGPFGPNDAGTDVLRVRNTCWIPPSYAALILKLSDRSPQNILKIVGRKVVADGLVVECISTLEWLRVALTRAAPGQPSILALPAPTPAPMHPKLTTARWRKVQADLPHLGQLPILQGASQIAGQIGSGINEFITWRAEELSRRDLDKAEKAGTPRKKWEHCLAELLRLTGCAAPEDLPDIWHKLAKVTTKNLRALIQAEVNKTARGLNLPQVLITPAFATTLNGIVTWLCDDYDVDVMQGFSLFNLLVKTKLWRMKDERIATAFDLAMANNTALSYESAVKFFDNDSTPTAATPAHTIVSVKGGWAVAKTFLPKTHGLVLAFQTFCDWWDANPLIIQETWEAFFEPLFFPTAVLFYLHKDLSTWINLQMYSPSVIPPPNFMEWVMKVLKKDNWYRGMPPGSAQSETPSFVHPNPVGSLMSDVTSVTAPSTVTTPSTPGPAASSRSPATTTVEVPRKHYQPPAEHQTEFDAFKNTKRSFKEIMEEAARANEPIPIDKNNTAYCLGYHVRGECWLNCKRHLNKKNPKLKSNHRRIDPAELATIIPWCTKWFGATAT